MLAIGTFRCGARWDATMANRKLAKYRAKRDFNVLYRGPTDLTGNFAPYKAGEHA